MQPTKNSNFAPEKYFPLRSPFTGAFFIYLIRMENVSIAIKEEGEVEVNNKRYYYKIEEVKPYEHSPELCRGWKTLYFRNEQGNEAVVYLVPDGIIKDKIEQVVEIRKW
jgi:hypothetical protein